VRSRKAALEGLLDWSIRLQVERRGRAFILDVASGPARYLQDVLLKFPDAAIEAVCWDLDEKWLDEGHESAGARGLRNMLYQRADALAAGSYARLPAWPNIAIASGFYDWIDDDELLRRSLRLVHDALSAGGHFLFTIQTGQVQLELTNALFRSFNGRPLRMTNRPAEVVHDWARQAGFELARTHRDRTGSYAVTVAEKVA
jgi:SAM-dependent methyltransferase